MSVSQSHRTISNNELAALLRETLTTDAGYFVRSWDDLQDCERVKWQRAAVVARLALRNESGSTARTVAVVTPLAERRAGAS